MAKKHFQQKYQAPINQRGLSLIVVMLILIVVSVLGVGDTNFNDG